MRKYFLLFLWSLAALPLLSSAASAEIGDKVPGCRVIYEASKLGALQELSRLEEVFQRYRWAEFKIRIFEYERLWKARRESNDPLSKETRFRGQHEEDRLLEELAAMDEVSKKSSNELLEGFRKIKNLHEELAPCCPDKDVQECLGKSLETLYVKADEGIGYFEHIFEHEREYRKEVSLSVGGRQGLYPEDTVELPVQHGDFFPRYEVERRQARFEEDAWMVHFFGELRKMLTDSFPGDDCCFRCGKTDWDRKSEKIFHEA